jgi:dipeptidyl aminopeptidase/acylaminoacyl peptidase
MNRSFLICAAVMATFVLAARPASANVLTKMDVVSGVKLQYKVVLPNNYDATKSYPTVIAFPGGEQSMQTVDGTLERNWKDQAEKRGYIVVIPAAPNGRLFFEGGEKVFPEFFNKILSDYNVLDKKFHIAGVSNGGISAFHIAAMYPQYFWSVTGLPGFLPTSQHGNALSGLCIDMYAGELDPDWAEQEAAEAEAFRAAGMKVEIAVEKGQGHVMETLSGDGAARLFDQFEEARKGGCSKQ